MKAANVGFTLLEVLVALAIVAVTSAALLSQTRSSLVAQGDLLSRQAALFYAENSLEEMLSRNTWPEVATTRTAVVIAQRELDVETRVLATSQENVRRVDVAIFDDKRRLVILSAFRGRY